MPWPGEPLPEIAKLLLPVEIVRRRDISDRVKIVWSVLSALADDHGVIRNFTKEQIGFFAGCSAGSAGRHLVILTKRRFIDSGASTQHGGSWMLLPVPSPPPKKKRKKKKKPAAPVAVAFSEVPK
jgi:hypothetical protein